MDGGAVIECLSSLTASCVLRAAITARFTLSLRFSSILFCCYLPPRCRSASPLRFLIYHCQEWASRN
ncbi:hypothetical protein AGJ34_11525 [Cronobacter dublinensis subsp. dublinensis]|nr:hypothetical protein [Cronobacter dublinensis subsp. dublinensis]NCH72473.1 hypothetical protein [Cronobacter dublinensis]EGT5669218.1 hypothetical protein [Cronobacter dublinensis subsp. dublinensis]EGT5673628.1 hypothetical protein [Cronobacter dublinensis subsp. dublinensis]EGT5676721.1 hypothetical protein [Cronobacter dublinensis subsp. dublinensis]